MPRSKYETDGKGRRALVERNGEWVDEAPGEVPDDAPASPQYHPPEADSPHDSYREFRSLLAGLIAAHGPCLAECREQIGGRVIVYSFDFRPLPPGCHPR